ncbi:hypothetical protein AVEN_264864-1 [Araneus ventricosus]|uniref:Endonuclease/exonuclease/phosphatase domain-containing protein n=1 Tax=Araneus ventricosus TaxID=182803 RepID=A0A4Y2L1W7_ARAVE|nr:hypothetical protein AVEN_264864-1 [Araneus ventricosus]
MICLICPPTTVMLLRLLLSLLKSGFLLSVSDVFAIMASFVLWNCRGIKHKNINLIGIINDYQPVFIALQETHIKDEDQINITQSSLKNDRASGRDALLVTHDSPYILLNLNTQLQAVAARIQVQSFITISNLYLLPNKPID